MTWAPLTCQAQAQSVASGRGRKCVIPVVQHSQLDQGKWTGCLLLEPMRHLLSLGSKKAFWSRSLDLRVSSTLAWKNPMDEGAWWAAVHGVAKSWTRLSNFTFTFHFHALEKEMATHSSVLAWRIPGTGEPSGLPSMGSHRVGHDWSDLAAAAAAAEVRYPTKGKGLAVGWNMA